jgi:DNA repair protein RadC
MEKRESISDPEITRQFLQIQLCGYTREVFACLFLDNQHRPTKYEELFFETIDGVNVHPLEVVKNALEFNAAAVIFGHNHPPGIPELSLADKRITERLWYAQALVEIQVLDHLVVGHAEITSFAERQLLCWVLLWSSISQVYPVDLEQVPFR